jgi:hypothetical protein
MAVVSIEPELGSEMCGAPPLVVDAAIDGDHVVAVGGQGRQRRRDRFLAGHRPVGHLELAAGNAGFDGLVDLVDARQLPVDFLERGRFDAQVRLGQHVFHPC